MPIDHTDAAFPFVQAANRKEEENKRKRARNRSNPSPRLLALSAALMAFAAGSNLASDQVGRALLFALLCVLHLVLAYQYRKRPV